MPVTVGDKISLADQAADPVNDGEIQRNGTAIKMKINGQVQNIGGDPTAILTWDGVQVQAVELWAGIGG